MVSIEFDSRQTSLPLLRCRDENPTDSRQGG